MIRLSTKGRYGTRLMINLARHYGIGNEAIILKQISEDLRPLRSFLLINHSSRGLSRRTFPPV